jgi:FtsH-binding integral membrane protein
MQKTKRTIAGIIAFLIANLLVYYGGAYLTAPIVAHQDPNNKLLLWLIWTALLGLCFGLTAIIYHLIKKMIIH